MINRKMLSEQVKETLLDAIISGRYAPGDRLVESQIARDLGISQSPVREALRDLVAMRFVEILPYKGARVRKVDPRELIEVYPVRAALEETAGRLAAGRLEDRISDLEDAVVEMEACAARGEVPGVVAADVEFHRIIVDAAGNSILTETWNSLLIEARTFVTATNLLISDVGIRRIASMHLPIVEAFRTCEPARCGAAMREHVEAFGAAMEKVYANAEKDNRPVDAGAQRDEAVSRDQADEHRDLRRLGAGG